MANNNPQLVRFVNEEIRPLCEAARALQIRIGSASKRWFGLIEPLLEKTDAIIEDGRDAEGVSRLSGAEIDVAMKALMAMADALNVDQIEKPTVQVLKVA